MRTALQYTCLVCKVLRCVFPLLFAVKGNMSKAIKIKKILVVHDSLEECAPIVASLRNDGFCTEEVRNNSKIIQSTMLFKPHIILIHVCTFEKKIMQLFRKLHINDKNYEVIVLNGDGQHKCTNEIMTAGIFSCIEKPFDYEKVKEDVGNALRIVAIKTKRLDRLHDLEQKVRYQAKELEQNLQIIESQSARLDYIINSMEDGLLAIDNNDTVVLMNGPVSNLLQLSFSACAGENVWKVLARTSFGDKLKSLIKTSGTAYTPRNYIHIHSPTYKDKHFMVKVSPLYDIEEESVGKLILFVDQTEKVRAELFRSSFFSIVAHELRTPISVIINYLSFMKRSAPRNDVHSEIVSDMETTCNQLKQLVNSIITLAGLSVSTVEVKYQQTALVSFISRLIKKFDSAINEKQVQVTIDNKKLATDSVYIDSRLFKIAFNALFDNAIKFNKIQGAIHIILQDRLDQDIPMLVMSIEDQGEGISEQKQCEIFSDFVQGEDPLTRYHKGLGTGLYITRRCVELLGGTISIDSKLGKGTRLNIAIPTGTQCDLLSSYRGC